MSALDTAPQSLQYDYSNGSPIDTSKFTVVHYNINSITADGRIQTLSDVCSTMNVSVLLITESKLDNTIPSNILKIPGYHEPVRNDRPLGGRHGGGTLMYISDKLTFKHKHLKQSQYYEHLWVDILTENKTIAINCLYRPPIETSESHDLFLSTANDILSQLTAYEADVKIVSGDLNFGNCFCLDPTLPFKPLDNAASQLFSSFGFTQLLDIPSRITDNTMSLLDLVFVESLDLVDQYGTLPPIADHDGTIVAFNIKQKFKKSTTKTIYDYRNADIDGAVNFIKSFNFDTNVFNNPLSEQAQAFTEVLKQALNKFVPTKTVCLKPNSIPWCNSYTRLLLRKKNRNYKIYKKSLVKYNGALNQINCDDELITLLKNKKDKNNKNFKIASKESLKANRRAKSAFFNSVNSTMTNFEISAKKKFSILTKLMNNQKFSSISSLIENGGMIEDSGQKANILNSHFAAKSTVHSPEDSVPQLDLRPNTTPFSTINTSSIEVAKIIRSIKKSNASYCGIPGKFLSFISTPISFSLSRLLNNHFEVGSFPDIWKTSHVTAIFKNKGLRSDKTNYRPISLLPTLSKICESIIHKRLLDHCTENNIICSKQAAYLKGDSTVSQLLYLVHKIRTQWTKGNITHGVFLDVQAAFDKVWHCGLIAKLQQLNINSEVLTLFSSYLSDRNQVTVVDGSKSTIQSVKAGVPQGSRLGPLLFIIYMNDIVQDIESDILIFADDTTLLASGKTLEQTTQTLNQDLQKISLWSTKWKVTFNTEKSKQLVFSQTQFNMSPLLLLNHKSIRQVNTHKHLGLHLTHNLDWGVHVYNVCLKANRKLAVLRRVKLLKRHTLDVLYKLTVRSVVDYALPVYYHTLKVTEKALLDRIQYTAGKLVTGALHFTNSTKLNEELGWESISSRADLLGYSIFHKIARGETRPLIKTCLPQRVLCNQTLRFGGFTPFPYKNAKYSNSFFPLFTSKYNKIENKIKLLDTVDFKIHIAKSIKPLKYKHYFRGSKHGNMLLTRIRVGRSYLNSHSYTIGLSDTNTCSCNDTSIESPLHYITQCPNYAVQRRTLLDQVEHFIPKIKQLSLKRQFDIFVLGYETSNPELININTKIMISTQHYIMSTKRFSSPS